MAFINRLKIKEKAMRCRFLCMFGQIFFPDGPFFFNYVLHLLAESGNICKKHGTGCTVF